MNATHPSHLLSDPAMIWLADAPALPEIGPIAQALPWLIEHLALPADPRALDRLDPDALDRDPGRMLQWLRRLGCDAQIRQVGPRELVQSDLPAVLTLATGDTCVVTAVHGRPGAARRCEVVVFAPEAMAFAVSDAELATECVGAALLVRCASRRPVTARPAPPPTTARAAPPAAREVVPQASIAAPDRIPVLHDVVDMPQARWPAAEVQTPAVPAVPVATVASTPASRPMAEPRAALTADFASETASQPVLGPIAARRAAQKALSAQTPHERRDAAVAAVPAARPAVPVVAEPKAVTSPVDGADARDVVLDLQFLDRHSGASQLRLKLAQRLRSAQGWAAWTSQSIRARWRANLGVRPGEVLLRPAKQGAKGALGEVLGAVLGAGLAPRAARHDSPAATPASACAAVSAPSDMASRPAPARSSAKDRGAEVRQEPFLNIVVGDDPLPASQLRAETAVWNLPAQLPASWMYEPTTGAEAQPVFADHHGTRPGAGASRRDDAVAASPMPHAKSAGPLKDWRRQTSFWLKRGLLASHEALSTVAQRAFAVGDWRVKPGAPPGTALAAAVGGAGATGGRSRQAVTAWLAKGLPFRWPRRLTVPSADAPGAIGAVPEAAGQAAVGPPTQGAAPPRRRIQDWLSRWRSRLSWRGKALITPPDWAPWLGAVPVDDWYRSAKALPLRVVDAVLEAAVAGVCLAQGLPLGWGRALVVDSLWSPLRQALSRQRPKPAVPLGRPGIRAGASASRGATARLPDEPLRAGDLALATPGRSLPEARASTRPAPRARVFAVDFSSALRSRSETLQIGPPRPPRPRRTDQPAELPGHRLMAA